MTITSELMVMTSEHAQNIYKDLYEDAKYLNAKWQGLKA